MAENIDYRAHAGHVVFPRNPQDLLSTALCPACFTPLGSTVCASCGLDLGHPDAAKLYDASLAVARTLDERLALIGKIRYEVARAATAAATAAPSSDASVPATTSAASAGEQLVSAAVAEQTSIAEPAATTPVPAPDPTHAPATAQSGSPAASFETPVRRRSSVQVTMLIVGVSLLSIAAIFFLVYAFINFGIIWRSVIIAAITVAAFVGAALLRRRALTATAEGIAAFAVVLTYLDAFAVRANDFFDTAQVDSRTYWGVVLIVAAAGFILWNRASALRIPNVVGFASFPLGVGILVGGLTQDLPTGTSTFYAFASIAVAGVIHRLAARPGSPAVPERVIVLCTTFVSLLVGLAACLFAFRGIDWAPTFTAVAIAIISAAHVWVLASRSNTSNLNRVFTRMFSALAGITTAAAVALSATRIDGHWFFLVAPSVAAAAVALALSIATARLSPSVAHASVLAAERSATALSVLLLLVPVVVAGGTVATVTVGTGIPPWSIEPTDTVPLFVGSSEWAVLALAIVTALAAAVWGATGQLRSHAKLTTVFWAASLTAVSAVPLLHIQWAVTAGWLVMSAGCLAALLITRANTPVLQRYRAVLITTMIVSGVLGYFVGLATTTTWWIGTLAIIGILVASRPLVARPGAKAALLGSGVGIALLSVGSFADQLTITTNFGVGVGLANQFVTTSIAAIVILLGAAIPDRWSSALDRRVQFWIAAAVTAIALPAATLIPAQLPASSRESLLFPENWTSLATALVLLVALTLWVGLRGNQALRPERAVASIAAAPVLYLAVSSFARLLQLPEFVASVAPITAAVLAAAGSLTVTAVRPTFARRWTRELGVALVGIPAVVAAIRADDGLTWLVLLLAAVAALLLAVDRDGLFSSHSARRHIGWLALALATAGLWWRLSGAHVAGLEYYVLPVTVALLLVSALIVRAARREKPPRNAVAAPLIALGGLLVSILPLSANAASGSTSYAVWLFAIGAVLLIAGSAIMGGILQQWFADACALAGAIGVIVVAVGRALYLPVTEIERDAWLAATFVTLTVAAFLQARARPTGDERLRSIAGQTFGLLAMTAVLVLEIPAIGVEGTGGIRALTLVLLFASIHVIAFLVSQPPLTRVISIVAISYAGIIGVAGVLMGTLNPVEIASIPVAAALLATGVTHLAAVPAARSWPWLGPGTAVLLATSLVATSDDRPLWRLVGLGIVGIATIVIAVGRLLQAPFVIGVIVILIHGIATFLPQLRTAYEFLPWWLWLGAGGVLLIVLAARYEQRIRDLKSVAMRFAALR